MITNNDIRRASVKINMQMVKGLLCAAFLILHSSFFTSINAAKVQFPHEGGTTSDGIIVTKPVLDHFTKMEDMESYQVDDQYTNPSVKFVVTVPEGKTAVVQYKLFFNISSMFMDEDVSIGSRITFNAKVDGMTVLSHDDPVTISRQADEIKIPEGTHEISLEVLFMPDNMQYSGSIDSLSIHVHQFVLKEKAAEPICGVKGENVYTCKGCNKDSVEVVMSSRTEHSWIVTPPGKKTSCMLNVAKMSRCEFCPMNSIEYIGSLDEHKFDANGKCNVCGLSMPKSNADGSVYEVNTASEMRVLSEMISIGRVSGNIGIDIKSDLVFSSDLPMMPLGTPDHPFQGVLNGNGHRIRGISNCYQSTDCLGFVGVAKGTLQAHAIVANLIFDGENNLKGDACVGGIIGYAENCDILNCASFGTLEGTNYVGGIVGYADLQVSIHHCASAANIKTQGTWNPIVCGMPNGHILNSYSASTNLSDGTLDLLPTASSRHCFSTQDGIGGFTRLSPDVFSSSAMLDLLKEQSETAYFEMSETDHYPIPVVNSDITAQHNKALGAPMRANLRRASRAAGNDNDTHEKDSAIEEFGNYVSENSPTQYFYTVEDIMRKNALLHPDLNCLYIVSRSVPEGTKLYEPITGEGDLLGLESYLIPDDSSYTRLREYTLVSSTQVKAIAETVMYQSGKKERIDQYNINNDNYTLQSRISFEDENNILYQENIDGVMRTVWSIETEYDKTGHAITANGFSHNYITGEKWLEYSSTYANEDSEAAQEGTSYTEYTEGDLIHILFNTTAPDDPNTILREHYILRASDQCLIETRTEKVTSGTTTLLSGMYFIFEDDGTLMQSVVFAPVKGSGELRPYMYYEYVGGWSANPITTAIEIPMVKKPSLKDRMDHNIYDIQGRMVSKVTDTKDPFSGLPRGLYIYQGKKHLKN